MATNRSVDPNVPRDRNEDPITGEPGAHPVGAGLGAAAGGAAAGAAGGAVGGPVGAVIGAVAGGIAGGLAGKAAGEAVDPTEEEAYWRDNYRTRDYVGTGEDFDVYRPAYSYGVTHAQKNAGRKFDEVEPALRSSWEADKPSMTWDRARPAVRDAYDRVCPRVARPANTRS